MGINTTSKNHMLINPIIKLFYLLISTLIYLLTPSHTPSILILSLDTYCWIPILFYFFGFQLLVSFCGILFSIFYIRHLHISPQKCFNGRSHLNVYHFNILLGNKSKATNETLHLEDVVRNIYVCFGSPL